MGEVEETWQGGGTEPAVQGVLDRELDRERARAFGEDLESDGDPGDRSGGHLAAGHGLGIRNGAAGCPPGTDGPEAAERQHRFHLPESEPRRGLVGDLHAELQLTTGLGRAFAAGLVQYRGVRRSHHRGTDGRPGGGGSGGCCCGMSFSGRVPSGEPDHEAGRQPGGREDGTPGRGPVQDREAVPVLLDDIVVIAVRGIHPIAAVHASSYAGIPVAAGVLMVNLGRIWWVLRCRAGAPPQVGRAGARPATERRLRRSSSPR